MSLDFPCTLRDPKVRVALSEVLSHIHQDFPEDYTRLKYKITRIAPHPNPEDGDQGEAKSVHPSEDDFFDQAWKTNPYFDEQYEVFYVEAELKPHYVDAIIAHELGHVATTKQQDLTACEKVDDSEWASEALADAYVLKWGYEKQLLALVAEGRDTGHHRISLTELQEYLDIVEQTDEDEWA